MPQFELKADFIPAGDQPQAINSLVNGLQQNKKHQVLLGITGSGKTFTMANIIQRIQRPTLIIAHNKTLAAQLFNEFKDFFPNNAVEYFVSFYDYYQPEAYVPKRDLYIEKDTSINDELERLRLSATRSLLEREDVIIVSSVSCIYGLGSPEEYGEMMLFFKEGDNIPRATLLDRLIELRYERNDFDFHRGSFRVRGDVVEIFMAESDYAIRVELFGDEVEQLTKFDPLTGKKQDSLSRIAIYPNSHYVTPAERMPTTLKMIRAELKEQLAQFSRENKLIEYQRLQQRTEYDLEMLEQTGFCKGIENYSRILQRRAPGSASPTLIDYFPRDALIFIDESHVTIPQIRGMYAGDFSRKTTLVDFGFRLPSALDNRPYKFEEFERTHQKRIYVSATPGPYELQHKQTSVVEQVIRPTGLLDPIVEVRPMMGQVDDMLDEIRVRIASKERVLITTLTKRMAEDLAEYYEDLGIAVRYMHSDIDAIERTQIIHDLRAGEFSVLIGINLLREGLDLPEVSLVGIFDADKEGFLRSTTSLIQTIGRAARNINGTVIMYADRITDSMQLAIKITDQRRIRQTKYNQHHNIIPKTIYKRLQDSLVSAEQAAMVAEVEATYHTTVQLESQINALEKEMLQAAAILNFEHAAELRDKIQILKNRLIGLEE
ncbi:MAG: excinuclease ABC subunit UvrB [SAR324 cluster bacterium]|nr:excinuclease ABC subunit UvrB [SAR324 cluster bacterium]